MIELLREEGTLNEIAACYGVSPIMISRWKVEFLERAPEVFKRGPSATEKDLEVEKERTAQLERKVGQLTYEVDWLKKNLKKLSAGVNERKACFEILSSYITVKRQAELLSVTGLAYIVNLYPGP